LGHAAPRGRGFNYNFQETIMIAIVARWGTNVLLVGMAMLTYAVFVLAK
jgi:hypothetical protein